VCDEPEEEPESERGGDGGRTDNDGRAALPVPSPLTLGAGGSLDMAFATIKKKQREARAPPFLRVKGQRWPVQSNSTLAWTTK
jgi:hypothetical protein